MVRLSLLLYAVLVTIPQIRGEPTCDLDYVLFSGQCYHFYKEPISTYDEAREICLRDDADLVSIHNTSENDYVGNMDKNGVLIGLRYYSAEDLYKWSDGSPLDYTSFADTFVVYRDYYGYCAKIVREKWTNVECDADRVEFACKKKARDIVITPDFKCPNATAVYFDSGMILSPGYPEPFDLDQSAQETGCYYRLAGKNGRSVRIKIDEYSVTEKNAGITIYKGWTEGESNKVARIGNDFKSSEIVVNYNIVLLHLTDAAHGKYMLTWDTVEGCPTTAWLNDSYSYYDGHCYYLNEAEVPYAMAKRMCEKMNSTLVSIMSQAEEDFVESIACVDTWIGLVKNGIWQWADGSPLTYTNWGNGLPFAVDTYGFLRQWKYHWWYGASDENTNFAMCTLCKWSAKESRRA